MKLVKEHQNYLPLDLKPFVKSVLFFQRTGFEMEEHPMPFFMDGSPGIMYIECDTEILLDKTRKLSTLFLYGQTVKTY